MEIKKYGRNKNGRFENTKEHYVSQSNGKYFIYNQNDYNEIVASADTPQELVQVGDLVKLDNEIILVTEGLLNGWKWLNVDYEIIYTPNSREGYDLQYKKEE